MMDINKSLIAAVACARENKAPLTWTYICRGHDKGCGGKAWACPECYAVRGDDPRTAAQIVADMQRGDA